MIGIVVDVPPDDGDGDDTLPIYRVGKPDGVWWSFDDPRGDPDYFGHHGMRHDRNPGDTISTGQLPIETIGTGARVIPAKDWDGAPLNNGYTEINIIDPSIILNRRHFSWPPGFFK
jgi:hypothetical protein